MICQCSSLGVGNDNACCASRYDMRLKAATRWPGMQSFHQSPICGAASSGEVRLEGRERRRKPDVTIRV